VKQESIRRFHMRVIDDKGCGWADIIGTVSEMARSAMQMAAAAALHFLGKFSVTMV